jgi:hypothetical protein
MDIPVKRSITNTGSPEGIYKDQIYIHQTNRILRYRKALNFIDFHYSKTIVKHCLRLNEKKLINDEKIKLL